ncbi:MAG: hypothetical protein ACI8R4_002563 [Paracoccaceae bacterium]|jgi:hypothetical protein
MHRVKPFLSGFPALLGRDQEWSWLDKVYLIWRFPLL